MQYWCSWATILRLLCLERPLAKCGIPPYKLSTRLTLAYAWAHLLVCGVLAAALKLSASDRGFWVIAGLAPVVPAVAQLTLFDAPQRTADKATLRAHYEHALALQKQYSDLPCFCILAASVAKKVDAALQALG